MLSSIFTFIFIIREVKIIKSKKSIQLSQAFPAILTIVLIAILVIVAIVIFTSLSTSFPLSTVTVVNETGWVNNTGYDVSNRTACGFTNPAIVSLYNISSGLVYTSTNAAISATGIVKNATASYGNNVGITYSYQWNGNGCVASATTITQFAAYPALIGLVGTIIFLALVIGVLVASFAFRRKGI